MSSLVSRQMGIQSVFTALFAAIIAVCGFISIPIPGTPLPIVLQNMMPILAGALLNGVQGAGATGLFLLAGALGLPVFSGGSGGIGAILGPTGGFLIGYFIAALVTGLYIGKASIKVKTPIHKIIVGCLLGFIVLYIPGVSQFMVVTQRTFAEALTLTIIPYLPGDAIKLILTVILSIKLRPVIARYLSTD